MSDSESTRVFSDGTTLMSAKGPTHSFGTHLAAQNSRHQSSIEGMGILASTSIPGGESDLVLVPRYVDHPLGTTLVRLQVTGYR